MFEKLIIFLSIILTLTACATTNVPEIKTLCQRDDIGNYIIKWETFPQLEGAVRIYVSDVPDYFDQSSPVGITSINNGVSKYITIDNTTRKYFMLSFNEQYFDIVGARAVSTDNVQNFRDLGGYITNDEKIVRWGTIFRSGTLEKINEIDRERIENLGIKTIIDLRTPEEIQSHWFVENNYRYTGDSVLIARKINIPVSNGDMDELKERINQNRMKKGDGILYMQDIYLQFLEKNSDKFAQALDLFLDKNNYPILFHCSLGKDRTGFLAALLLAALDVPEETIMKDYTASNDYINLQEIATYARSLNTDGQETITALLNANPIYLEVVFKKIKKKYGSINKYLEEKLNFTTKKQEQLKEILLY